MKNDLSKKKKLEFAATSTSQERMLREDNFASSENLKQVTFLKNCSKCLSQRSIVRFNFNSYNSLVKELVPYVLSYGGRSYICRICHSKVKKYNVPCQAVSNK